MADSNVLEAMPMEQAIVEAVVGVRPPTVVPSSRTKMLAVAERRVARSCHRAGPPAGHASRRRFQAHVARASLTFEGFGGFRGVSPEGFLVM
jgi:hypothetical protein